MRYKLYALLFIINWIIMIRFTGLSSQSKSKPQILSHQVWAIWQCLQSHPPLLIKQVISYVTNINIMHLYLYYLQLQFTSHKRNITVILSSHSSERMPYLCGSCSLNRTKTRFYLNLFFFGLFYIFQAMLL